MSAHPKPNPEQTPREDQLKIDAVTNRKSWAADKIVAERFPLGEPDDYKPCIARLPSGELLLTTFHQHQRRQQSHGADVAVSFAQWGTDVATDAD